MKAISTPVIAESGWVTCSSALLETNPVSASTTRTSPGPSANPRVSPAVHSPVNTPARTSPVRSRSAATASGIIANGNIWQPPYATPHTAMATATVASPMSRPPAMRSRAPTRNTRVEARKPRVLPNRWATQFQNGITTIAGATRHTNRIVIDVGLPDDVRGVVLRRAEHGGEAECLDHEPDQQGHEGAVVPDDADLVHQAALSRRGHTGAGLRQPDDAQPDARRA